MIPNITISVNATVEETDENEVLILLRLILTNNSDNDYFILRRSLLLDEVVCAVNIKIISGPSYIYCGLPCRETDLEDRSFKLISGESIDNEITLSRWCDFIEALPGIYTVYFETGIYPTLESDPENFVFLRLTGQSQFEIPSIGIEV